MRLTTRTNLAARLLMVCAVQPERLLRTAEIARACNCSTNHAAHVVQKLQAEGYLQTLRGRAGGIRLALPTDRISIGRVFHAFEAEIPFAECFSPETNSCPLIGQCRLQRFLKRALEAFYHELDRVTLADLVEGNCGLEALLALHPEAPGGVCPAAAPRRKPGPHDRGPGED